MLCFILDLLMDCPSIISLRAACKLSSVYCLYRLTGALLRRPPSFRPAAAGGCALAAKEVKEPVKEEGEEPVNDGEGSGLLG